MINNATDDWIEEKGTHEELLKKISLLDLMQQVATAANETNDVESLLQFALDRVCAITGWKLGHVYLWSHQTDVLEIAPIWYLEEERALKEFRSSIENSFLGTGLPKRVLEERKPIWIENLQSGSNSDLEILASKANLDSVFAVPIWNRERIVGVMEFFFSLEIPDPSIVETLSHVGSQIGRVFERRDAENNLRKSREQLRALSARLQEVREEERILIAREIHDELGQILTVLKIDITLLKRNFPDSTFESVKFKNELNSMNQLVDTAIQSIQRIATELRPMILDDLGLLEGMEWFSEQFQKRTGILCTVTRNIGPVSPSKDSAVALFRIFQETLTNVARHSKASCVNIFLSEDGSFLTMKISDNGIGILEKELTDSKSLGLIGIRERAIVLGGEATIFGESGQGTVVNVRIPYHRVQSEDNV
ncbi:GAF domain-containing protein [Leptospira sp. WS92.C1]